MKTHNTKYDVIVLEAGSAGQACALRCAELGLSTLCIKALQPNKFHQPYSTNLENLSIISLLESAKLYESVAESINEHGIFVEDITVDFRQMVERKNTILNETFNTLSQAFETHHVDFFSAQAQLLNANTVKIISSDETTNAIFHAENIILATESVPITLPFAPIDNQFILDSTAAVNFKEIPKNIAILGAGIMGLQIAGVWNRLGASVTILEAQDTFLNVADYQISSLAYQIFVEQGLELKLGARVISSRIISNKVVVEYQDSEGIHAIKVDKLIVASGRKPNSENIAAPESNLLLDEDGFIHTNEEYRTNLPCVYAIGDLTMHGPMLSHKGIAEAHLVAERIAGITSNTINYRTIPNVIYTEPEIAWVGYNEQYLKSMGESIKTAAYSFQRNLRAKAYGKTSGFVKIITNSKTDEILGVHVLGAHASEIIAEAALAIEFCASSEDLTRAVHSHPSFNESFYELGCYLSK